MKNLVILLCAIVAGLSATYAQTSSNKYKKLRLNIMAGLAAAPGYRPEDPNGLTSPGGAYSFEARYNASDKVGVGLKYSYADVLTGGKDPRSLIGNITYYLNDDDGRFFIAGGLGVGRETYSKNDPVRGQARVYDRVTMLTFVPQVGAEMGRIIINGSIFITSGKPTVFLVGTIGFYIGGGKKH